MQVGCLWVGGLWVGGLRVRDLRVGGLQVRGLQVGGLRVGDMEIWRFAGLEFIHSILYSSSIYLLCALLCTYFTSARVRVLYQPDQFEYVTVFFGILVNYWMIGEWVGDW